MPGSVDTLILDLLEWIGPNPRPYAEVLEAWRTSCPQAPVWEDANDQGFIARHHAPGRGALVSVSAAGAQHLRNHRQRSPRSLGPGARQVQSPYGGVSPVAVDE